jgi:hypothetical protein
MGNLTLPKAFPQMKTRYTPLMITYLSFSIAGLIVPWYFNIQHILYSPVSFTIAEYFRQGTATPLAASITSDFFIGTVPALIWLVVEFRRLKMKHMWLYIAGTFLIAFAFTFPLFLFMRERKLQTLSPAIA